MTQSPPLSAIEEAASAWFMRRQDRASDAGAEQAFQAWLAQSPLHRQEYERLTQVWDDMAALPRQASVRTRAQAQQPARRPVFLRWGGALAALALAVGAAYQYMPVNYTSVANASTQTRDVDLPDGSRIHANVGTR
ncbi:MAG: DUF4880 domain-containing protein, partial [Achromobacter pestifer]